MMYLISYLITNFQLFNYEKYINIETFTTIKYNLFGLGVLVHN